MKQKQKIHKKDLQIIKGKIEVDCIIVDNKPINLTPVAHASLDKYCTHDDCSVCGKEFEKEFGYEHACPSCVRQKEVERYNSLEPVDWDGETPLVIFDDDTYFMDEDEIADYCEEQECRPEDLMLVVCTCSNLSEIDLDYWQDETHEDWEPSDELLNRLKEFNEFLSKESSSTWFQGKKRVKISL